MKKITGKPELDHQGSSNSKMENTSPHPLDNVVASALSGSFLEIQTGMFNLALNRARQSGTTEPRPEDIRALEDHARAIARNIYRDRYDPARNVHDAMHQTEYERYLAQREEAEKGEQHSVANLRDAEDKLASTPKAGPKPAADPLLVTASIVAITLTVAPTLHDSVFQSIGDDILEWFAASLSGAFVGGMLTLAILNGRRSAWTWLGVAAGVILGLGLGAIRLSSAEGVRETLFAFGLTIVEIAAVLLLEWLASGLRASEAEWLPKHDAEIEAIALRDAAQADLTRWQSRIKDLNDAIIGKIAFVEDRHNRNRHVGHVETQLLKTAGDAYNAGMSENIGRVRGVKRRIK